MPTIRDENGERDIGEGELAWLSAEGDTRFAAFWDALAWRPIDEYDRSTSDICLLRDGRSASKGYRQPVAAELVADLPRQPRCRANQRLSRLPSQVDLTNTRNAADLLQPSLDQFQNLPQAHTGTSRSSRRHARGQR